MDQRSGRAAEQERHTLVLGPAWGAGADAQPLDKLDNDSVVVAQRLLPVETSSVLPLELPSTPLFFPLLCVSSW